MMGLPLGAGARAAPPGFGLGGGGAWGHQHHWLRTIQGQPHPVCFPPEAHSSRGIRAQARGFCINLEESEINSVGACSIQGRMAKGGVHVPGFPVPPAMCRGRWQGGLQGGVASCPGPPEPATPCLPPSAAPWGSCKVKPFVYCVKGALFCDALAGPQQPVGPSTFPSVALLSLRTAPSRGFSRFLQPDRFLLLAGPCPLFSGC